MIVINVCAFIESTQFRPPIAIKSSIAFSVADTCKNCAKCDKGFKIGTNEACNKKIKLRAGSSWKIFCFCLYANMAASDKGISLKRKILEEFLLDFKNQAYSIERAHKINPKRLWNHID